ncbi:Maternal embryonic leucine zipper kinase [Tetrabaena socialis]|uniref:Maternal embryonic leucine zipper kinase n=1 Tax=Tetrabaena socialis TaxID=47790 RepID=A0A2J7ZP41_9CHLO|nr:Maternal embryonic leucine zipper kinase [Tetrabaena socialis]|eukprot:PNH02039.1 Maternal embryonic leucine zipper kinase [Tetrabaena socialis]
MQLLCSSPSCPPELCTSIAEASCLSDAFETRRPLAFHSDCYVSVAKCKCDGNEVVVKAYMRDQLSPGALQQVQTEIDIHSGLQHPNIVRFLAACEDYAHIYLLIEYAEGGDLRKHLQGGPLLTECRIRNFFIAPVLHALNVLHNKGFSHRDLKPENCLLGGADTDTVKLADFGLSQPTHLAEDSCSNTDTDSGSAGGCASASRSMDSDCSSTCSRGTAVFATAGGTPLYAAPEVLRAMFKNHGMQAAVGPKNDVWALGVMALEVVTGCHPFSPDHYHYENVLYSIAHCTRVNLPTNLSPEFTDFLEQALHRDPSQRASTAELLAHPWISKEFSEADLAATARCATQSQALPPDNDLASFDCWEY